MPPSDRILQPARPGPWLPSWAVLLALSLAVLGAAEAVLLELGLTYFSSGFNGAYIDSVPLIAGFFASSTLVDLFLILGVWALLVPLLSRLRLGPLAVWTLAGVAAVGAPIAHDLARYQLYAVLGRVVSVRALWQLAGRETTVAASEAAGQLQSLAPMLVALAAALVLLVLAARRIEAGLADRGARFAPPATRTLWGACLVSGVAGALTLLLAGQAAPRIVAGLLAKPSAKALAEIVRRVSDVDRDGFGLLSRPSDPAPFDASIHPYAAEVPGNGIDEDGVGGDLPPGFAPVEAASADLPPPGAPRRHLLVIFLESFRADLVERRFEGREITPFLNRLSREGALSWKAYVHTPFTVPSRAQFFGGRLDFAPGQDTLVADFRQLGYTVAHFSGQDDSLSGSEALLGTARADAFYDARQDRERHTGRTANESALQISWKLLEERVLAFLEQHDPARPLFLYVNIVDTHFPYHHDELDDILGVEPIARHAIRADRAERVWATYANTAANVDRAIERLVERWWARLGRDGGILITADHGQSFYENGVLGHGQFLDASQTQVPFVLWGIGGDWPEPLGLADVRGLLRRNLPRAGEGTALPARFVPDPERWIFQYVPRLDRPRRIALRSLDRSVQYVFESGRTSLEGPHESLRAPDAPRGAPDGEDLPTWLIRTWEAHALRLAGRGEPAS